LARVLPAIKREHKIDFVIANGENSADGNGILPHSADMLLSSGVDVITGGNHSFRRKEIFDLLDGNDRLLRPANMPNSAPGKGWGIYDCGRTFVGVINLLGTTYMESLDCPFRTATELAEHLKSQGAKIILVDFHAEATSEKNTFARYFDGRATAIVGTHTHVQTSDALVLPGGTAYLTDLGMTGPYVGSIGRDLKPVTKKFITGIPARFDVADGPCVLEGAVITFDPATRKAAAIEPIRVREPLDG
jgi:metallophosphoesterase (TIGR00282 family)